jgi:lysophospholipase L1-like esterase
MRRHQLVLAVAFLALCASFGFTDEGPVIEPIIPAATFPTKAFGSIAAIGDSITQAFNAAYSEFESCQYRDTPEYNFSTNKITNTTVSIAERAIAFKGSGVVTANFGSDGARMSSGDDQALEAKTWLLRQAAPRLITVFLGHNDICSGERDKFPGLCSSTNRDPNNYCRTSAFAYEQQMRQMLDVLVTIPDSQIVIIHPIRVSQLCNFREEKVIDEWYLTRRCGDLWDMSGLLPPIFEQDGVCPSLTSCTADRVADAYTTWITYRDISDRVVNEYNEVGSGGSIPSKSDFGTGGVVRESGVYIVTTGVIGNSKFKYRDSSGNVQLSVCECFHPSKYGQNTLASSLWDGVSCSTATPCCNDSVESDSDYNKGLCVNTTTSGWMGGPWAALEEDKILMVEKAGSGTGVVTSAMGDIDCGTDCIETYSHGTVVNLTASADIGSVFRGWSGGGCSGTAPECIVTMVANTTVAAAFSLAPHLSVNEGTIGTQITITGSDFGVRKGRVLIQKIAAKIAKDGWAAASITCTLTRVPPLGTHDVTIKPNKADDIGLYSAFTVKPPEIDSLDYYTGAAGDTITITGTFFGTRKGKIYLEYEKNGKPKKKNCKVTSWGMDSITFVVPKTSKNFPAGAYPLKVMNKVDIAGAPSDFTID